jgi:transcription termination factor Rho
MSDDIQPEEVPKKKAAKKAAAKKAAPIKKEAAPVKKATAKKAAVKKAKAKTEPDALLTPAVEAVTEELPLASEPSSTPQKRKRLNAVQKKAAAILAKMQETSAAPTPTEAAIVPSAPAKEAEVHAPGEVVAEDSRVVASSSEPLITRQVASVPEAPPSSSNNHGSTSALLHEESADDEAEPHAEETGVGQEPGRKKTRWERWKERRERFKAEKMARRLAQQTGGAAPSVNSSSASNGSKLQEEDAPFSPEVVLGPPEPAEGILELNVKGHGFLRLRDRMFAQHPLDPFVHGDTIRQLGLREGMHVKGIAQKGPRGLIITSISEVNARVPDSVRDLPLFEELKAVNPNKRIQFETTKERITTRVIDMFTPVGRGQRGLIVAPPRTGKTTLLQHIAEAVVQNHPGMHLIILLVDERPEEVTEFKRAFPNADVFASSNDQDVKSHTRIATLAIERAKRLVEAGEHVFMLMDSITRLARAFNNAKSGGATMSGGMAVGGMEIPRRLFAAARNTRGAGSLTILATALIETGSRMDDVIFLEFKGTGNMELVLDRKLAEQYYYPAVNIFKSGTRREELLLPAFQLDKIHMLRRGLAGGKPIDAIQRVITLSERYPSNAQMLVDLPGKAG